MIVSLRAKANNGVALQRTKFVRSPLDYYPEDKWCSERLFHVEQFGPNVLDPSCGSGRIVDAARAAGYLAMGSDIASDEDRRPDFVHDWLAPDYPDLDGEWDIVSNPPFMHCLSKGRRNPETGRRRVPFVYLKLAVERMARKCAMLLPADYLTGERRQAWLSTTPLARVHYLSPRPWCGPAHIPEEERSQGFTDLIWLVWVRGHRGPWTGHFLSRDRGANNGIRRFP